MADKVVYRIGGKQYISVVIPITESNQSKAQKVEKRLFKLGAIPRGAKVRSAGGLFSSGYGESMYLVPASKRKELTKILR